FTNLPPELQRYYLGLKDSVGADASISSEPEPAPEPLSAPRATGDVVSKGEGQPANPRGYTSTQINDTIGPDVNSGRSTTTLSARAEGEGPKRSATAETGLGKRPVGHILEDVARGKNYTTRVAGRHHFLPRSLGNGLPYGDDALTLLGGRQHTILQGE